MTRNKEETIEWWKLRLDKRFGHSDYLKLNSNFKKLHLEQCAHEIVTALDIHYEKGEENANKTK